MTWMTAGLWGSVWSDNPGSGKFIILLIVGVAVVAAWRGRQGLEGLKNEGLWIGRAEEALLGRLQLAREAEVPEPLDPGSLLGPEAERSLVQQRIAILQGLQARRVKISIQQLQSLARESLENRPGLKEPSRAAHVAMMLGIIGTFVGLASMVQEIQFALPAGGGGNMQNWMDGFDNVTAVMGGIKTAFSTSLVGMTAALGLTWMGNRLEDRQAAVLLHLERFTATELLPSLRPDLEGATLLEDLTRRMEDAYDSLEEASERNTIFLDKLSGIHEAYIALVGQLRELGRSEASQDFGQLMEDVAQTNRAVLKVVDALPRAVDAIERGQRKLRQNLNPFHQIVLGFSRLWSAQLPFGIPGAAVILSLGLVVALLALALVM